MYTGQIFHTGQITALTKRNFRVLHSSGFDDLGLAMANLHQCTPFNIYFFLAALLILFYSLSSMALTR